MKYIRCGLAKPRIEIAAMSGIFFLLMAMRVEFAVVPLGLTAIAAVLLAFMTREDAKEQTVDLRLFAGLALVMLGLAAWEDKTGAFLLRAVFGVMFFRIFLLFLSVWTTWRAAYFSFLPKTLYVSGSEAAKESSARIGYIPIFMLTVWLYMGLGESLAPIIFERTTEAAALIEEFFAVFPVMLLFFTAVWLRFEWYFWRRGKNGQPIVWAFGGGDVLILGLFTAYLGTGALLAVFWLSLVIQIIFCAMRMVFIKFSRREIV